MSPYTALHLTTVLRSLQVNTTFMSVVAALETFADHPCRSKGGRKYAFTVSVTIKGSGGQERQVSAPKRTYSVIPNMS
jgi:hypothetical protein